MTAETLLDFVKKDMAPSGEIRVESLEAAEPTIAEQIVATGKTQTDCVSTASDSEEAQPAVKQNTAESITFPENTQTSTPTPPSQSPEQAIEMEEETACYIQSRIAGSPFFQSNPGALLPVLDIDEIHLGNFLGQGEFGRVREVTEIVDKVGHEGISRLLKQGKPLNGSSSFQNQSKSVQDSELNFARMSSKGSDQDDSSSDDDKDFQTIKEDNDGDASEGSLEIVNNIEEAKRARKVLKKRCWREGRARYAVKQLREELLEPPEEGEDFNMGSIGAMDLAMEAVLLSSLSHPNIVKLRATAGIPGRPGYMLVMDRLYTTLDQQILGWKEELPKTGKMQKLKENLDLSQSFSTLKRTMSAEKRAADRLARQAQLLNRMYAAYDVARALRYLHENKIVYRDIKPQNIAYDIRGDVRIFDFGLAKELLESAIVRYPDDYNATGMTGSRRWMSPEVYFCEPYGLSADVYSFGLLLWNLMYLETPFGDRLSLQAHHKKVMVKGQRPLRLRTKLIPDSIWSLMEVCWAKDRGDRPNMDIVCDVLKREVSSLKMQLQMSTGSNSAYNSPFAKNYSKHSATSIPSLEDESLKLSSRSGSFRRSRPARMIPVINIFQRRKGQNFHEAVDVSCHHPGKKSNKKTLANRAARAQQMQASLTKMTLLQKHIHFRTSDIDERSDYLMQKSLMSLAMVQTSSNMHLSGSSHPQGEENRRRSMRPSIFLFGESGWSLGNSSNHEKQQLMHAD